MNDLVGTWTLVSMIASDQATGHEVHPWGEAPVGRLTYTGDGRMSAVLAAAARTISTASASNAPIEEQAQLFRKLVAYAGRYTVTAEEVVHHVEVAADPTWIGKDERRFIRLDGDRLLLTTPPMTTSFASTPQVFTLVWDRARAA
jgi:hypothetical protein